MGGTEKYINYFVYNIDMKRRFVNLQELVWYELGEFKRFPDRTSFNDVIKWLIAEQKKREEAKELLK